jgi:KipI family sensor histidine kinase inhibitor
VGTVRRFRTVGSRALLVEYDNLESVRAAYAEVQRRRNGEGAIVARDIVPGATTILFDGVPDTKALARDLASWQTVKPLVDDGQLVEIPTTYNGPDLAVVASCWGVDIGDVALIHQSFEYEVAFCGFVPGFSYLSGLPANREVPRRASPRPSVERGSVAIGGCFTAIYPRSTPGGWQLIGHTDLTLWDPMTDPPALLPPGSRVRFVATEP